MKWLLYCFHVPHEETEDQRKYNIEVLLAEFKMAELALHPEMMLVSTT